MKQGLKGYISNSISELTAHLSVDLFNFQKLDALPQKHIVVPSQAMQDYLQRELLKFSEAGVVFGVRYLYLGEALQKMRSSSSEACRPILGYAEIAWRILIYFQSDENLQNPLFSSINSYMNTLSMKQKKRSIELLSCKLARVFLKYHKFAKDLLNHWNAGESDEWQAVLWKEIFGDDLDRIEVFAYDLSYKSHEENNKEWYFFGWNFIPKVFHKFLKGASDFQKVSYYTLSPCKLFWLDTPSYQEQFTQRKRWERLDLSEDEMEYAESLIEDVHPLLLSSGRMGKPLLDWMEEECVSISKSYEIAIFCKLDPMYEALLFEDESTVYTNSNCHMLQFLQSDILAMLERSAPLNLKEKCSSIQVHIAPSKFREVQSIYDQVLHTLQKDPSLHPDDFIICAPQIDSYYHEINSIFGDKESELSHHILDPLSFKSNQVIESIYLWMNLLLSGKAADLFCLIRHPVICQARKWGEDALCIIKDWISEQLSNQIFLTACQAVLHLQTCARKSYSDLFSIDQAKPFEEGKSLGVDGTKQAALSDFFAFLDRLALDVLLVEHPNNKSFIAWKEYFLSRFTNDFFIEYSELIPKEEYEDCLKFLQAPVDICSFEGEVSLSFVWRLYVNSLEQEVKLKKRKPGHIHFSSLLTQRCVPSKVLILMGMNLEDFPRREEKGGLDLLYQHPKLFDPCPKISDRDRYLFLESIIAAKQALIISYHDPEAIAQKDLTGASPLITELFQYLDEAYCLKGMLPSKECIYYHPNRDYDPKYFQGEKLNAYSNRRYHLAKLHLKHKQGPSRCPFPEIYNSKLLKPTELGDWSLQSILLLIKNPQEFYFRSQLNLRLDQSRAVFKHEDVESIFPSALDQYHIEKSMWKYSHSQFNKLVEKSSLLREGHLGKIYWKHLALEFEAREAFLKRYHIKKENFFSLELAEGYGDPFKQEGSWFASPITWDGTEDTLSGSIDLLSPNGNVIEGKDRDRDKLLYYVKNLFLQTLKEKYSDAPISSNNISWSPKNKELLDPVENPSKQLYFLVDLLKTCSSNFCPFPSSSWLSLVDMDMNRFKSSVLNASKRPLKGGWVSPYYTWSFTDVESLPLEQIFHLWAPKVSRAFSAMKGVSNANI